MTCIIKNNTYKAVTNINRKINFFKFLRNSNLTVSATWVTLLFIPISCFLKIVCCWFISDSCIFLPPDSVDGDPGGQVDYWTDSLEARFPAPANMEWRVYQSTKSYNKNDAQDWYADLYIYMTVGNEEGDFGLSYFVTNAALDFSDSTWYAISQNNSITITGATDVSNPGVVVKNYSLKQNYPNPFNPSTSIPFSITKSGNVKLSVFNSLGEEVTTLVNGFLPAGLKTVKFYAQNFQSGVYYYRLETSNFIETKKMVLLK